MTGPSDLKEGGRFIPAVWYRMNVERHPSTKPAPASGRCGTVCTMFKLCFCYYTFDADVAVNQYARVCVSVCVSMCVCVYVCVCVCVCVCLSLSLSLSLSVCVCGFLIDFKFIISVFCLSNIFLLPN